MIGSYIVNCSLNEPIVGTIYNAKNVTIKSPSRVVTVDTRAAPDWTPSGFDIITGSFS